MLHRVPQGGGVVQWNATFIYDNTKLIFGDNSMNNTHYQEMEPIFSVVLRKNIVFLVSLFFLCFPVSELCPDNKESTE